MLEMMIALMLSSILFIEIFRYSYLLENSAIFSSHKVETIEKENVLFAQVAQDIEKAGYLACVDARARKNIIDDAGVLQSVWLSASENVLFTQYMSTQQLSILKKLSDNAIVIEGGSHLKVNDVVVLASCFDAQVLKIKNVGSVNYGAQNKITFYSMMRFSENSHNIYLAKLIQHRFFIRNSSLYLEDEAGNSDEILQDVVSMHFSVAQNNWTMAVMTTQASDPLVITARAYNVF